MPQSGGQASGVEALKKSPDGGLTQATDPGVAYTLAVPREIGLDPAAMTAEATVSTEALDYSRQIVLTDGVRLSNYARNPVVLFEHGLSDWKLPLAISADDNGQLWVNKRSETLPLIEAKSFHAPVIENAPAAYQYFGLIDSGVLRATSVQLIPASVGAYVDREGKKFEVIEEADLVEWSWCSLGVNPEAVAKALLPAAWEQVRAAHQLQTDCALAVLEKGTVGNERLLPAVRKSLQSLIPPASPTAPGFDFEEQPMANDLTDTTTQPPEGQDTAEPVTVTKAIDADRIETLEDLESAAEEPQVADESAATEEVAEEVAEEAAEDAPQLAPLGALRLEEMHAGLRSFSDYFESQFAAVENEKVLSGVEGLMGQLAAMVAEVEGVYADAYPGRQLPAQPDAGADAGEGDGEFDAQLKSLIAGDQRASFQARGTIGAIRRLLASDRIPSGERKSLDMICKSLSALHERAKNFEPGPPAGYVPESRYRELEEKNRRLSERAEKLLAKVEEMSQPAS